jgi:hypothetical protein
MQFRTSTVLGLLGLIPFFFFIALSFHNPHYSMALRGFLHYSVIVLSFLGGINWGLLAQAQTMGQTSSLKSYWISSVIPPLAAWAILCLPPKWSSFLVLAIMYIVQYFLDVRLTKKNILPYWLLQLRRVLTLFVMMGFIIILIRTW